MEHDPDPRELEPDNEEVVRRAMRAEVQRALRSAESPAGEHLMVRVVYLPYFTLAASAICGFVAILALVTGYGDIALAAICLAIVATVRLAATARLWAAGGTQRDLWSRSRNGTTQSLLGSRQDRGR